MSIYPPPTQSDLIFDLDNWELITTDNSITSYYLQNNYTKFPTSQTGTQFLDDSTIQGNMTVSGSTICNTFDNYSTAPATTSIYDTTTGSGFKIRIGGSMTAGQTIQMGGPYTLPSISYNVNYIGGWYHYVIVESISRVRLGYSDPATDVYIGDLQTTGVLELSCGANKAERIAFGSTNTSQINIGSSGTTTNIIGPVRVNTSTVNIANGVLIITNTAYTLDYLTNPYDLLIHNKSTSLYTLTLPSTIQNYSFWIFTENFDYTISSPTYNITFGQDSALTFTMQANSSAYIFCNTTTNTFVLTYSSNQRYKYPTLQYPLLSSLSIVSGQNGYLFHSATNSQSRSAGAGSTLSLASPAMPIGIYYMESVVYFDVTVVGTSLFVGGYTTAITTSSSDPTLYVGEFFYEVKSSTLLTNLTTSAGTRLLTAMTSGYYNNTVAGRVLYGYARSYGATNTGYTYSLNNVFRIFKIV